MNAAQWALQESTAYRGVLIHMIFSVFSGERGDKPFARRMDSRITDREAERSLVDAGSSVWFTLHLIQKAVHIILKTGT